MTWKIFATFGAGFVLITVPAFSAPRDGIAPPPPNATQQRPPNPASPPPPAFGAAAARRAQVLGHQDLAHTPLQYHPLAHSPLPAQPQMGFGGAYGRPSPLGRQPHPVTQGQASPPPPMPSPSWTRGGATRPSQGGVNTGSNPWIRGRGRLSPYPAGPNLGTSGAAPIPQTSPQPSNQWRQKHHFVGRSVPNDRPGPQSRYGHPDYNPGYGRPNPYQGYPRRHFYHRNANHMWERSWEHDYNAYNRFHWRPYIPPHGWYPQQWQFGMYLPYLFWTRNYWITNYWSFGLPQPPYGYIWVREGNNALLVNEQDGYILQVIYNIFY